MHVTDYHAKYFAYELTKRFSSDKLEKLAGTFAGAQVDINPHQVRLEVEQAGAKIIMVDSVLGYKLSFQADDLIRNIHSLCQYLKGKGVTTLLTNEVETITGDFKATELGVSYLADNIIFLRYLEIQGQLRRAIGVLKKRLSDFEKTLREFEISRYGIKVGRPLTQLRGILSGVPEFLKSHDYES